MSDPKKPGESYIGPAPPKSVVGEVQSAYLSSHNLMQFLDKVTANLRNLAVENVRGMVPASVDRSVTSAFTDAAKAASYVLSGDFMRPGDRQFSQSFTAHLERSLDRNGKPAEFGEYDIMMAAGWHPKGPIKVNGEMKVLDKPIDNMLAVFVRNKDGSIEILDPSIKVTSLMQMPRLLDAVTPFSVRSAMPTSPFMDPAYKKMALTNTPSDDRWRDTAGTFVLTQMAGMALSGGLLALGKGGTALATKFPQLEKIASASSALTATGKAGAGVVGFATTSTGLGAAGGTMSQSFYFTPAAIDKIAQGISNALNAPKITAASMRDSLNSALHEHSFNQGNDAKQLYVPSLGKNERPWTRLQEACEGLVTAYQKPNHPWEPWGLMPRQLEVGEIRDALAKHPGVNSAFYTAVDKHLSGKPLTDQDMFVLRVGYKLGPGAPADMDPVGSKSTDTSFNFTEQERKETLRVVDAQLHRRLAAVIFADSTPAETKRAGELIKKYGIDPKILEKANDDPGLILSHKFTPAQIKAFATDELNSVNSTIDQQKKADLAKAQGRVMALGMGL